MNSDDWMINGCVQGMIQILIPNQAGYYIWYEDPENPAGITFLIGDEVSYDLEYEQWIRFLEEIGVTPAPEETLNQRLADYCRDQGLAAVEAKLMNASGQYDSISFSS